MAGIVLFHTNSSAMRAEAVLRRAGFPVKFIPTPRGLSSDCGVALQFATDQQESVEQILEKARVETAGIHVINLDSNLTVSAT